MDEDQHDLNESLNIIEVEGDDNDDDEANQVTPLLYRIYRSSVQRQRAEIAALNSHAAYVMLLDEPRRIIGYAGSNCSKQDFAMMKEIGREVMKYDYGFKERDEQDFPIILEGSEPPELLEAFLDILWTTPAIYNSKSAQMERKVDIENKPVSVGLLQRKEDDTFEMIETAFAHPDSDGSVPRVTFPPLEEDSVVFVSIGEQWDLWIARGATEDLAMNSMSFMETIIASQLTEDSGKLNHEALLEYIQIILQGAERTLFRRPLKIFTDFEPPGKTAVRTLRTQLSSLYHRAPQNKKFLPVTFSELGMMEDPKSSVASNSMKTMEQYPSTDLPLTNNNLRISSEMQGSMDTSHILGNDNQFELDLNNLLHPDTPIEHVNFFEDVKPNLSETPKKRSTIIRMANDGLELGITEEMVEIIDEENVNLQQRKELIIETRSNPASLLGWQVEIDEGLYQGIFVVVGCKKTRITRKTLFHLAGPAGDDFWIRLQRGASKGGIKFRPLRQVAIIQ